MSTNFHSVAKKMIAAILVVVVTMGGVPGFFGGNGYVQVHAMAGSLGQYDNSTLEGKIAKYSALKALRAEVYSCIPGMISFLESIGWTRDRYKIYKKLLKEWDPAALDKTIKSLSDYYEGKTDRLNGFLTARDIDAVLFAPEEVGRSFDNKHPFLVAVLIMGDDTTSKQKYDNMILKYNNAMIMARESIRDSDITKMRSALLEYNEAIDIHADWYKRCGYEKCIYNILSFKNSHHSPSEYPNMSPSDITEEIDLVAETALACDWLYYYNLAIDYKEYLSGLSSRTSYEEEMYSKLKDFCFEVFYNAGDLVVNEMLSHFSFLPIDPEKTGKTITVTDPGGYFKYTGTATAIRNARYIDIKNWLTSLKSNIDALISIDSTIQSFNPGGANAQVLDDLKTLQNDWPELSAKINQVSVSVSDYFAGRTDNIPYESNASYAEEYIKKIMAFSGDPSSAARNMDVVIADCAASVSDANEVLKSKSIKVAERALLEYGDALMNAGYSCLYLDYVNVKSEMEHFEKNLKDPSGYQNFNESELLSASDTVNKIYRYIMGLFYIYWGTDYRDFCFDHPAAAADDILAVVNRYTFGNLAPCHEAISKKLLPFIMPVSKEPLKPKVPQPVPEQPKTLSPTGRSTVLLLGEKYLFTPSEKLLGKGNTMISWKISNEKIAKKDEEGNIVPLKKGTTSIKVTVQTPKGKKKTIKISLRVKAPVRVKSISLKSSKTLKAGKNLTLTAMIKPFNATNKNVIWNNSDPKVISVSFKGTKAKIHAVKSGQAFLTVTSEDGGISRICTINVTEPVKVSSVSLPVAMTLKKNKSKTLKAAVVPKNATNKKLIWTSSDKSIATVGSRGLVKAKNPGVAIITAATEDGSVKAQCKITVE